MQFIFFKDGGKNLIEINGEIYNHIFKSRRHKSNEPIYIRSQNNFKNLYKYNIKDINRRTAILELDSFVENFAERKREIILGWCKTDSQTVEKILPVLNELGIDILYLIDCKFSQGDFKTDFDRYSRILENSSMQSGRYDYIIIKEAKSINEFLELFPETVAIDFSDEKLSENIYKNNKNIYMVIGPEGGFHVDEQKNFKTICGLNSPYILKSSTAIITAIAKIL